MACTSQAESHNCELTRCSCKRHDEPVEAAIARQMNRQRFCFNPRPSHEGRRYAEKIVAAEQTFQPMSLA